MKINPIHTIYHLPYTIYKWSTATRLRKALSITLVILITLTSIRYIFLKPKEVLADSLISFNEGYGTTVGDASSNISGTITGATWKAEDLCFDSKCLYFDGDGDLISFGDDSDLDFAGAANFTLEGWFRTPEISAGQRTIIAKHDGQGTDGGYKVYIDSNGYVLFGIDNDQSSFPSDTATTSTTAFDDNKWHHFAAVKTGTTSITIYVDGIQYSTDSSITSATLANADTFYVGIDGDGAASDYSGFLDEIKVYGTARTAAEVKSDFLGETPSRGTSAYFGPNQSYLSDGLSGYWKMDETSGNRSDSSGNAITLTDNATVTSNPGKFGNAGQFTATNSEYLSVNDNSSVSANGDFTITAWIYFDNRDDDQAIVTKGTPSAPGTSEYALYWDSVAQRIKFLTSDATGGSLGTNYQIVTANNQGNPESGTWYFIIAWFDSSSNTVNIQVNNGTVDTASYTGVQGDGTASFRIGANSNNTGFFDGRIDEARLYKSLLSSSERSSLYSWAPPPLAHLNFDENTGGTANDISGNSNSFAATGATVDTGFKTPASTGEDYNQWSTPTNVSSSNDAYASETTSSDRQDYYDFTFGVPEGATINGIELALEASKCDSTCGDSYIINTDLSWNGGTNYTSIKQTTDLATTDATYTLGSSSDTWGRTWSSSEFSNANFRLRVESLVGGASFPEGSLLLGADGIYKPIENFNVGDKVLSLDTEKRVFVENEVTSLRESPKDKIYILNGEVKTTGDELIFASSPETTEFKWILVEDLKVGDTVLKEEGRKVSEKLIDSIETNEGEFTVYTVKTEKPHNNYWVNNYLFDPPGLGLGIDHLQVKVYYTESNGTISWTSGKFGSAFNGNGASFITRADDSDFDFASTDNFTTSFWFKSDSATNPGANEYILDKEAGTGYGIYMTTGGLITFGIDSDGTWTPADTAASIADVYDGNWHHFAAVKNGTTSIQAYVDGVLVGTDSSLTASGSLANSDSLTIGDQDGTDDGDEFTGDIDELKIYRYARTSGQIVEDMNGGHPSPGSPIGSAVGKWQFDEGALNTCTGGSNDFCDQSINANDLAFTGTGGFTNSGKFGKGYDGGDNERATRNDDSDFDFLAAESFTISMWTNSAAEGFEYLITKKSGNVGYALSQADDGFVGIGIGDSGSASFPEDNVNSTFALTPGVWNHIVAVKEGTSAIRLYINGLLNDSDTSLAANGDLSNSGKLILGDIDESNGSDEWLGDIDQVEIYRSALNSDAVKTLYNQGSGQTLGSLSTDSSGNPSNSAQREFCPPGNTEGNCGGSNNPSPVLLWNLNENSGTSANDTTGNNNTGTLTNSPTWRSGKYSSGLNLAGSNQHVTIADGSQTGLDFGASASFTLETWFKHGAASAAETLVAKIEAADTSDGGYKLKMENDGDITCETDDDDADTTADDTITTSAATYDDNNWHHVVCVYDVTNTDLLIYIDGILTASDTSTNNGSLTNNDAFFYGIESASGSEDWVGQLDNLMVYTYARTQAQVAWSYNRGAPLAWWVMDESSWTGNCSTNTVNDSSGNSLHGKACPNASAPNTTTGKYNKAGDFDGTNDYVSIADNDKLDIVGDLTISHWVYLDSVVTAFPSNDTVTKEQVSPSDIASYVVGVTDTTTTPHWAYYHHRSGGTYEDSETIFTQALATTGSWHLISITRDVATRTVSIYVDGKFVESQTYSSADGPGANTADVLIAGRPDHTPLDNYIDGKIDDLRIYNYKLSSKQVELAYNEGSSIRFAPVTGTP